MGDSGEISARFSGPRSIGKRLAGRLAFALDTAFDSDRLLVDGVRRDIATASRAAVRAPAKVRRHLLVPTVGKGNIGDQAMFEAFLQNTTWPVTVLVGHGDGHEVPVHSLDRVRKVVIPQLFSTRPWIRHSIRRRLTDLIASHATLSVIGADIMDGGYGSAESTIRVGMLCIGNEVGTPSRVLGFSWNGAPSWAVHRTLGLSQPNSLLCVRDPHSLARLRAEGTFNIIQTADTVFTLRSVEPYEQIRPWLAAEAGRTLVIVNVSGILARNGVSASEYVGIIRHLVARECSVALLPHVIRAGDDDLASCRAVTAELGHSTHVHLVEDLLSPGQIAWLAAQASAVLTGRMHLSILALSQRVPPAVLSTQGKVSGLMELFEIPELALEPDRGFARSAIAALDLILDDPTIRLRVERSLPQVRKLAVQNFSGLEELPN
jgi:polysaccharide pyruvyl transferase WcaK-like protein